MSRRVTASLLLVVLLAGLLCVVSAPAVGQTVSETNGTEASVGASSVATVEITPSTNQTITAGGGLDFNATAYDSDGNVVVDDDSQFVWTQSGYWSEINMTGYFDSNQAGNYTVWANYNGTVSATNVSVEPGPIHTIQVEPEEPVVATGDQLKFDATAYDEYGNPNETDDMKFNWWTESGYIQTDGSYIAPAFSQTHSVEAHLADTAGSATVQVYPHEVNRITISPENDTDIIAGAEINFTATAYNSSGAEMGLSDDYFTWQSSPFSDINGTGYFSDYRAGTYEINATLSDVTSNSTNVTVEPHVLRRVSIVGAPRGIMAGVSRDISAIGMDRYGNIIEDNDSAFSWSVTGGSITESGQYTAPTTAHDEHEIRAELSGFAGRVPVYIMAGPLDYVTLAPVNPTVGTGGTLHFNATAYDVYGNPKLGGSFTWNADSGSITDTGSYTAPTTNGTQNVTVGYADSTGQTSKDTQVTVLETGALTLSSLDVAGQEEDTFLAVGTNESVSGNLTNAVTASRAVNLSLIIERVSDGTVASMNQTLNMAPESNRSFQFSNITGGLEPGFYVIQVSASTDSADTQRIWNLTISVDTTGDGNLARDTDTDRLMDDVDGDQDVDIFDVQSLFTERNETVVRDNPTLFDFNNDTVIDIFDVQALFDRLTNQAGFSTADVEAVASH